MKEQDKTDVIAVLNHILEAELAGVVRYTHHALMVHGFSRIPIVEWMRAQAGESLIHANEAGEMLTHLGGEPSLGIGQLLEKRTYGISEMLRESLAHEKRALGLYHELEALIRDQSVMLEEYARTMIVEEEKHVGELEKMLRKPDDE